MLCPSPASSSSLSSPNGRALPRPFQTGKCAKIRIMKQSQPNLRERIANEYASHKKPNRERPGCTTPTLTLSHRSLSTNWHWQGLNSLEKACYNGYNREPLANGPLIELLARLRESRGGKEAIRV